MTFCLAMKCSDGLLAIADTRIMSGSEMSEAKKISVYGSRSHALFILSSGLRSVRDKTLTYFDDRLEHGDEQFDRMYKAVNAFAEELRRVRAEDATWLEDGGLHFDLMTIIGGQLEGDREHQLYLIYPEGNWVEVSAGTPYVIIGESRYGKPLLDRVWCYEASLADALRDGLLAFDATRTSSAGVDYPADVVLYRRDSYSLLEQRFSSDDLQPIAEHWMGAIRNAVSQSSALVAPLFAALENGAALEPAGVDRWSARGQAHPTPS